MADLTKEEKKALRKEKFQKFKEKVKTALPYIAGTVGALVCLGGGAYLGYDAGKKKGRKDYFGSPEQRLRDGIIAYNAADTYRRIQFESTLNDNYGCEFVNNETGDVKYMVTSISDEKPEWWDNEGVSKFDLAETIADDISNS